MRYFSYVALVLVTGLQRILLDQPGQACWQAGNEPHYYPQPWTTPFPPHSASLPCHCSLRTACRAPSVPARIPHATILMSGGAASGCLCPADCLTLTDCIAGATPASKQVRTLWTPTPHQNRQPACQLHPRKAYFPISRAPNFPPVP